MSNSTTHNLLKLSKRINTYFSAVEFYLSEVGMTKLESVVLTLIQEQEESSEDSLEKHIVGGIIPVRRAIRKLGRSCFMHLNDNKKYIISLEGEKVISNIRDIQLRISSFLNERIAEKDREAFDNSVQELADLLDPPIQCQATEELTTPARA